VLFRSELKKIAVEFDRLQAVSRSDSNLVVNFTGLRELSPATAKPGDPSGVVVSNDNIDAYLNLMQMQDAESMHLKQEAEDHRALVAQLMANIKANKEYQAIVAEVTKYEAENKAAVTTMREKLNAMGLTAVQQAIIANNTRIQVGLDKEWAKIDADALKDGIALDDARIQRLKDIAAASAASRQQQTSDLIVIEDMKKTALENEKAQWTEIDNITGRFFSDMFNDGKNAFKHLGESLKNDFIKVLYEMTARKWIFEIFADVKGGASGALTNSVMGAGAGSFGTGDLLNGASAASGLSSFGSGAVFSTLDSMAGGSLSALT